MSDTHAQWVVTEVDVKNVLSGITMQAKAAGLDVTDPAVIRFINHQADVIGSYNAQARWLQGFLHGPNAHSWVDSSTDV